MLTGTSANFTKKTKEAKSMNAIQTVTINSTDIAVKEYNGKRVVTFKDIDACHERPEGTARKRFNDNKYRFIEGEDYFTINQPSEIRTAVFLCVRFGGSWYNTTAGRCTG